MACVCRQGVNYRSRLGVNIKKIYGRIWMDVKTSNETGHPFHALFHNTR